MQYSSRRLALPCGWCGRTVWRWRAHLGASGRAFCNRECKALALRIDDRHDRVCPVCGAKLRNPSPIRIYCSRACWRRGTTPTDPAVYFWPRVDKNGPTARPELGPCWIWTRKRSKAGYGQADALGVRRYAHRVSYELAHGPLPPGAHVCHRCDVPACVRPEHLFLSGHNGNMADMATKERAGGTRLTASQVAAIRAIYAAGGVRQTDLAVVYGVDKTTIRQVVRGGTWRHV